MKLKDIAKAIEIKESLEELYEKKEKSQPWFLELLQKAYIELGKKIKLSSANHQFVTYEHACNTIDQISMTLACIYEEKISQLRKANASRTKKSDQDRPSN